MILKEVITNYNCESTVVGLALATMLFVFVCNSYPFGRASVSV